MEDFFDEFKNKPHRFCNNCKKVANCQPESFWDVMPEGCFLQGWLFQKRETLKQQVRKLKELLLDLEVNHNNPEPKDIEEKIKKIKIKIKEYKKYGSDDW